MNDTLPKRTVIDVRTPGEVRAQSVPGAVCIPLDEIEERIDEIRSLDGEPLLLCHSGRRAEEARQKLTALGVSHIDVIDGGMQAWVASGGETVRGKGVISIERQVRIVAGILVSLGVALGAWLHPAFLLLSAFIGLGLAFAGITDSCGMALVLSKMPWNRR